MCVGRFDVINTAHVERSPPPALLLVSLYLSLQHTRTPSLFGCRYRASHPLHASLTPVPRVPTNKSALILPAYVRERLDALFTGFVEHTYIDSIAIGKRVLVLLPTIRWFCFIQEMVLHYCCRCPFIYGDKTALSETAIATKPF